MVRGAEGIGGSGRGEEATMPGEEILEAEVGGEMACASGDTVGVEWAVAGERQRLRFLAPFHCFQVEEPDIPIRADNVGGVRVEVLRGEGGNFRGAVALVAKIP